MFEDDPDIQQMVNLLLETNGCEVFTYEDPSQSLLQQEHDCQCKDNEVCADIVITDIDMPFVSGLDFIEEQIQKGCKVENIAILSGAWTDENEKRARALGCEVLKKPSFFSELSDWIEKCLARMGKQPNLSNWFIDAKR